MKTLSLSIAGRAALLWLAASAGAAPVTVTIANRSAITASNVASAGAAQNGNFDTADGCVGIRSSLVGSLSTLSFSAVLDQATGEVGVRWGLQADPCLGTGGCGGSDHCADATADLVLLISVAPRVATWEIEISVQSYGNINGIAFARAWTPAQASPSSTPATPPASPTRTATATAISIWATNPTTAASGSPIA